MQKQWLSPVYGFFEKEVPIGRLGRRPYVEFKCLSRTCKVLGGLVRRFLDTTDRSSTSNLKRHAEKCWGEETVQQCFTSDIEGVRKGITLKRDGSITAAFQPKGHGVVTYSLRPLTNGDVR